MSWRGDSDFSGTYERGDNFMMTIRVSLGGKNGIREKEKVVIVPFSNGMYFLDQFCLLFGFHTASGSHVGD